MLAWRRQAQPFGLAVLLGSVAGATIVAASIFGLPDSGEWIGAVLVTALVALMALPFVALGLGIFGVPLTTLLDRRAYRWWGGTIAVLLGAIVGKLMFLVMDTLFRFNGWFPGVSEPGIAFGAPTAFAWWLIMRNRLSARE